MLKVIKLKGQTWNTIRGGSPYNYNLYIRGKEKKRKRKKKINTENRI